MYIHHCEIPEDFLAGGVGPYVGIGEEESLLRGEAVVGVKSAVFLLPHLEGFVGDIESAVVGEVFSEAEGSVGFEFAWDYPE